MTEKENWESKPEKSKEKAGNQKINKRSKMNKNNKEETEKSVWETKNLMDVEASDLYIQFESKL